jgi:hypothetical protein
VHVLYVDGGMLLYPAFGKVVKKRRASAQCGFGTRSDESESVLPIRLRPDFLVVFEVMWEGLSTGAGARRPESGL